MRVCAWVCAYMTRAALLRIISVHTAARPRAPALVEEPLQEGGGGRREKAAGGRRTQAVTVLLFLVQGLVLAVVHVVARHRIVDLIGGLEGSVGGWGVD